MNAPNPPHWARWLLTRLHPDDTLEEVEGDLDELYAYWYARAGKTQATLRYLLNVVSVLPPFVRKRQRNTEQYQSPSNFSTDMLRNYVKIAYRNLLQQKGYSFINVGGLGMGMAVAILIGLWIWDELSYDKYHQNYDRIVQVMQHVTNDGEIRTWSSTPFPLAEELRKSYGTDFQHVVLAREDGNRILAYGDKKLSKRGVYFEPQITQMLTLKMLKGTRDGLKNPASILLSESVANAFFGETDPIGKLMKIDNDTPVKVTGVYEDLPQNSTFHGVTFMAPWELYYNSHEWIRTLADPWRPNAFDIYAQLIPNADITNVSAKIKDAKLQKISTELAKNKPILFLHPMSQWHLYSDFENGVNAGGRIRYVWLIGIIGVFVLLLACINFMNLSTARSENRAKEVGIRKALGSVRTQLIYQFFSESLLMVAFSFVFALLLALLTLPFFNGIGGKTMSIPWANPLFWLAGLGFCLLCGLLAGSYPAFYLSSFQAIKVLKSSRFRVGRWAAVPRKVLVTLQFTISVTLIISTIIVFRQIQHAQNRPIGYDNTGLVMSPMITSEIHTHFDAIKSELIKSGAIIEMAESGSPLTETWSSSNTLEWKGKDPSLSVEFPTVDVSHDYGETVSWSLKEGRDFSRNFSTDSSGIILNETAVKFMGLTNPVGQIINWHQDPYHVIGVVNDLVMHSPYEPIKPSIFHLATKPGAVILLKISPSARVREALSRIEMVFKKFNPAQPFEYRFVDEEYNKKFADEERVGQFAGLFSMLAIFISCLGIFGLASFTAEQRTKEIGIRKVLGASVLNLWQMLAKDFIRLVLLACFIASPITYYLLSRWLERYQYRTEISWWIFALAGVGALLITLLTISFQSIKAALVNPVKSLRSE